MPHGKIARMSGVPEHTMHSGVDHECYKTAYGAHERFAGLSEHEIREFLKEEQREGIHPSLKGKHF